MGSFPQQFMMILPQEEGDGDAPNYDITVYHNITDGQAESYVLEGDLAGTEEDFGIPVNHVLQYIRENKGVNTAVLEVCLC